MQESFLHYIWQFQYFDKQELRTTDGEEVQIIHPGVHNTNAGPDFSQAKIRIGNVHWAGMVEIHTQSSDWINHKHTSDAAYDNVVLHVVWKDNQPIFRADGTPLPTIELGDRIDPSLVLQYRTLVASGFAIPCARTFHEVNAITKLSMLERAVLHRVERKSSHVKELLQQGNGDWEEVAYQMLGRSFGVKINSEPFEQLVRNLPYKIILKHIDQRLQVEALIFGQAGFLQEDFPDFYHRSLRKEYQILSAKYKLNEQRLKASQWRFLRLRPANFPTLRLAQFAALLAKQANLFSKMKERLDYGRLSSLFQVQQSDYWRSHYRFGKEAKALVPELGKTSIDHIIINSVVPLMVHYGKQTDDPLLVNAALRVLEEMPTEKNNVLEDWSELGWRVGNAFDSQGLIELHHSFCLPRQCLNCNIGASILKPKMV